MVNRGLLGELDPVRRWMVILAGGDGIRLRSLTRMIAGDERPKQFCPILGRGTLLEQTRRRAALADRNLMVVTRAHERFYTPLVARMPSRHLVIQPENRGTAPAILYALLRLARKAPTDLVAILPSDHYVSDEAAFMAHVDQAFEAARVRPEFIVLLGITPHGPEVEYGWIEPAEPVPVQGPGAFFRVRRFWEKPSLAQAEALFARGCLWNSFVMVGRVSTFLTLIRSTTPDLYAAFEEVRPAFDTESETEAIEAVYDRLPSMNFSHQVLAARPASLAVLPVSGVEWSDWGEPGRVLTSLARRGAAAQWAVPAAVRSA